MVLLKKVIWEMKWKMNYEDVIKQETLRLYSEWLPYTVGTDNKNITFDDWYKRANLVFFSDSHIDFENPEESLQNVKDTVNFINEAPVLIDAVMHGGDIITPFYLFKKEDALKRATSFFEAVKKSKAPFLFAKGNHDLNDWENLPEEVITDNDWGNLFLNEAEEKYGIVRQNKANGLKSTWHYYDIEAHKIRIVILDVQDSDKKSVTENGTVKYHGGVSTHITNEQMNWIASDALNFDEK